jgi:hypothetical protein
MRSSVFRVVWPDTSPGFLSFCLRFLDKLGRQVCSTTPAFIETEVSQTFCLGWPQISNLFISASWVAGITNVSQCTNLKLTFVSYVRLAFIKVHLYWESAISPDSSYPKYRIVFFWGQGRTVLAIEPRTLHKLGTCTTPSLGYRYLNLPAAFFLFSSLLFSSLLFSFLLSTGVWTQSLTLARQVLFHLSHSTRPVLCWVFLR